MVRRVGPVLVVFALLALIITIAAMTSSQVTQLPVPEGSYRPFTPPAMPTAAAPSAPPGLADGSPSTAASTVAIALVVVLGAALLVGLAFLVRYLVRRRIWERLERFQVTRVPLPRAVSAEPVADDPGAVDEAIQQGLDELDDDAADPRRAVIACWVRLERLAALAGAGRASSDTPAELVGRLLAHRDVSGDVLRRLASLYRRARYAPAAVDEAMRAEARSTLERLRSELAGRP